MDKQNGNVNKEEEITKSNQIEILKLPRTIPEMKKLSERSRAGLIKQKKKSGNFKIEPWKLNLRSRMKKKE